MVQVASMTQRDGGVDGALRVVRWAVRALPDVQEIAHDGIGAGWEFRMADEELGHVHADGVLHVRLGHAERDLLVAAGLCSALPHDTEERWVEYRMRSTNDAYVATALLQRSRRAVRRHARRHDHEFAQELVTA